MSADATRWAWQQNVKPSAKLILLSLADRAGEENKCWPSIARLQEDTGLDKKTIFSYLKSLEELGLIRTINRFSASNIYELIGVENRGVSQKYHYVYCVENIKTNEYYIGVRSCDSDPANDVYFGSGKWSRMQCKSDLSKEILAVYDSRDEAEYQESVLIKENIFNPLCRNLNTESYRLLDSKNGAEGIPKTEVVYTEFGTTKNGIEVYSKNGIEGIPKTEEGYTKNGIEGIPKTEYEPKREPNKNLKENLKDTQKQKNAVFELLSEFGIDGVLASDFVSHRKKLKAEITKTALAGFQREADKAGLSVVDAVRTSIERGWRGFCADWINKTGYVTANKSELIKQQTRAALDEFLECAL